MGTPKVIKAPPCGASMYLLGIQSSMRRRGERSYLSSLSEQWLGQRCGGFSTAQSLSGSVSVRRDE